jgi:alpha-tubulin suppressor-like RCC1 family protein
MVIFIYNIASLSDAVVPNVRKDKRGNIPTIPAVNYLQSGKPLNTAEIGAIKQVVCGEDHSYIIDENNNAYCCGKNSKGQLALGHTWEVEYPTLLSDLRGRIKAIKSSGDVNIAITISNELYVWPYDINTYKNKPLRFHLDKKITVSNVSCGCNFTILLTLQGILYTFGKSNKYGELGTGDNEPRKNPEPIYSLSDAGERIMMISCGYKHTTSKSANGKVFTWGLVTFII